LSPGAYTQAAADTRAVLAARFKQDRSDVADLPHKYPSGTGKGNMYFLYLIDFRKVFFRQKSVARSHKRKHT
jgi:hypothetical protein